MNQTKFMKRKFKNIDEYIAEFPQNIQDLLEALRQVIIEAAPNAKEAISYQMPTFKLRGNLVYFAAHKYHIGFHPTSSEIIEFKEELSRYEQSKGVIRFPLNKPIPFDLVKKIVEFRVEEQRKIHNKK